MAKRTKNDIVTYIVEFDDGGTAYFTIDRFTNASGDYIARIIARERQSAGLIPNKPIKSVRRDLGHLPDHTQYYLPTASGARTGFEWQRVRQAKLVRSSG